MSLSTCLSFNCRKLEPAGNAYEGKSCKGLGVVLVGHKCIVLGGDTTPFQSKTYIFDTVKRSWRSCAPLNSDSVMGYVKMSYVLNDMLFAYVWNHKDFEYTFVKLDLLQMEAWTAVPDQNRPKKTFRAVGCFVENHKEAVITWVTSQQVRIACYPEVGRTWRVPTVRGVVPKFKSKHGMCADGHNVFVLGKKEIHGELMMFTLNLAESRARWSEVRAKGTAPGLAYFSLHCLEDRIIVYGGEGSVCGIDVFSLGERRWLSGVSLGGEWRETNREHASVLLYNKILVFGGRNTVRKPEEITPVEE